MITAAASRALRTNWIGAAALVLATAQAHATSHEFGEFHIDVSDDGGAATSTSDYQITVANDELMLTRLSAAYEGRLSNSFVSDLNKDGDFEVIVTFSFDGGRATGVHAYTFENYLLKPHRIAALDAGQSAGYRGADEFAVVDGELVRIFQLYEKTADEWAPTAQQRRLRYSFDERRWRDD